MFLFRQTKTCTCRDEDKKEWEPNSKMVIHISHWFIYVYKSDHLPSDLGGLFGSCDVSSCRYQAAAAAAAASLPYIALVCFLYACVVHHGSLLRVRVNLLQSGL